MKIAIIAPGLFQFGEIRYGGTERVVMEEVTGLIRLGHEVTVYAARGSAFPDGAEVVGVLDPVFGLVSGPDEYYLRSAAHFGLAMKEISQRTDFDIVHIHCEAWQAGVHSSRLPVVVTHHNGWLNIAEHYAAHFPEVAHVAISESERSLMALGGVDAYRVYNNVSRDLVALSRGFRKAEGDEQYAVVIGRMDPQKGFHLAAEACIRLGLRLKIVAPNPEPRGVQKTYYDEKLAPVFKAHPALIEHVGPQSGRAKALYLAEAAVGVIPNAWDRVEPFGLVGPEMLLCGTMVVAPRLGALPETVGEAGVIFSAYEDEEAYVTELTNSMAWALDHPISRATCREQGLKFTEGMTEGYLEVFRQVLQA